MTTLKQAESNLAKWSDRRAEMKTELELVNEELATLEGGSAEHILGGGDLDKLSGDISMLTDKGKKLRAAIEMGKQREADAINLVAEIRRKHAIKQGQAIVKDARKQLADAKTHVAALEDIGECLLDAEHRLQSLNSVAYLPGESSPSPYFRPEMGLLLRRPQMAIVEITDQFRIHAKAEEAYKKQYDGRGG